jgi:hypothetical protein
VVVAVKGARAPALGNEQLMAAVFGWGVLAASSLVIGAIVALTIDSGIPSSTVPSTIASAEPLS